MTNTISEDALKGQQNRIMNAMRTAMQPNQQVPNSGDLLQAMTAQAGGQGNYFDMMRRFSTERARTNIDAETGVYNQMKEQVARGNAEAKGVDDAITEVAGNDPKLYAGLLQDLHNDPEPVNASNAKSKVMKYAAAKGISPLSLQMDKAKINKLNSYIAREAKGPEDPASIREWKEFQKMTPQKQQEYIHMKRTSGDEALDKKLGEKGATAYADLQTKVQEAENFTNNIDVARQKLAIAKMTGPVFGRIGKAASDPAYVDWQGAKNGLTLLAKSIYGMPNANFSDADRDFLDQITGGKFPSKEAADRTIDRIELIANKAIRSAKKNQQDILDRKTYNRESKNDTSTDTPKRLKYNPTTGEFE